MHGNNRQKYESVFRVGDANRNGYMTEAEVFAVAKCMLNVIFG
jgi:Ca2+-binding EF-hand superfamily protein